MRTPRTAQKLSHSNGVGGVIQPARTSAVNLIHLNGALKGFVTGYFEFRNTRNETQFVSKDTTDFIDIKVYFNKEKLHYLIISVGF
jgi:hypothetical protein